MSKDNCWDSHAARHKIIFKQQRIIQMFFGLQNHHRWWLQPWNWKTLAPWKKSYDKPSQCIKKRDITLPTKVHIVKAMLFPVVMYGYKSWTIKKAEWWRIDVFKLWCWRRLLRVPWTARRYNQPIIKDISPEYSLEGLMLQLKFNTLATWWEGLIHLKKPWCWELLKSGGEGDDRGWDDWMSSFTHWTWVSVNPGS